MYEERHLLAFANKRFMLRTFFYSPFKVSDANDNIRINILTIKHPELQSKWSKAFLARGYYFATVGNITEDAIKKYI